MAERTRTELEDDLKAAREEISRLDGLLHTYHREDTERARRQAARARKQAWKDFTRSPAADSGPTLVTEITWLRMHIEHAGRALHAQHGQDNPWPKSCKCVGCELIVATDIRETGAVHDDEIGPRSSVAQRLMEAELELDIAKSHLKFYQAKEPS
jgi:hypothetical protein